MDVGAEVVGAEAEVLGYRLEGGGQIMLFEALQNSHHLAGVAAAGGKA